MNNSESLENILMSGVVPDIHDAEQALAVVRFISENAKPMNDSRYGPFFGAIQHHLGRELLLCISRLLEYESRGYPLHSLRTLTAATLDSRRYAQGLDRSALVSELVSRGQDRASLLGRDDGELVTLLAGQLKATLDGERLPSGKTMNEFSEDVKHVRDKTIAHHEALPWDHVVPSVKVDDIAEAIERAKRVVTTVGLVYESILFSPNEGYLLSDDATMATRALQHMWSLVRQSKE